MGVHLIDYGFGDAVINGHTILNPGERIAWDRVPVVRLGGPNARSAGMSDDDIRLRWLRNEAARLGATIATETAHPAPAVMGGSRTPRADAIRADMNRQRRRLAAVRMPAVVPPPVTSAPRAALPPAPAPPARSPRPRMTTARPFRMLPQAGPVLRY